LKGNINIALFSKINGSFYGGDYNNIVKEERIRSRIVTHWTDVTPPSNFVGREVELDELYNLLNEGHALIHINGMGGIGKTCFLRKLFNKYQEEGVSTYDYVGMITYEDDFDTSLVRSLKFDEPPNGENSVIRAWTELEYLASAGNLLLFIDQVEVSAKEDSSLQNLFTIPCSIVVCSRRKSISNKFIPYPLGVLSQSQCISLYESICGSVQTEDKIALNDVLGNKVKWHTQTIELLAKLAETKGWSPVILRQNLEERGIMLSFAEDGEVVNLQETFSKIFGLSQLSASEVNALEGLALFPSIPLPRELCDELFIEDAQVAEIASELPIWKKLISGKKKVNQIQKKCDDCIKTLERKGWLEVMETYIYYMHPIISMSILNSSTIYENTHRKMICTCCDRLDSEKSSSNLERWKFLPLAVQVAEKVKFQSQELLLDLYKKIAECYSQNSHHDKALAWYKRIYNIVKELPIEEAMFRIKEVMLKSADELAGMGEFEKAVDAFGESLKLMLESGANSEEIEYCYKRMSSSYEMLEQFDYAFKECCNCLRFIYRSQGKINLSVCSVLERFADIFSRRGKYQSQLKCYEKVRTLYDEMQVTQWEEWATLWENFGAVYLSMGDYFNAIKFYQDALNLYQINGYNDSVMIVKLLQEMCRAYTYAPEMKKENAEIHMKRAISICEKEMSTGFELGNIYNNAGIMYGNLNQIEKAIDYLMRANQIYKEIFPKWHGILVSNYCNIANYFGRIEKFDEAEKYIDIAEKNLNERGEKERQEHAGIYYSRGVLLIECNRKEEGLKWCKRAYNLLLKTNGLNYSNTKVIIEGCQIQYRKVYPHGDFEKWLEVSEY